MKGLKWPLFTRKKWFRIPLVLIVLWISLHMVVITWQGLQNDPHPADVAIVLGNRVYADGSLANWTKGRVDRALELYREGKVKRIFCSGGLGGEDHFPEGTAMRNYLLAQGVPDSAVVADNEGVNSYATAVDFNAWNEERKYRKVIVVSQFYHISRSVYILRKTGFQGAIYSASSKQYQFKDLFGTLREVPAFYKYMLVY